MTKDLLQELVDTRKGTKRLRDEHETPAANGPGVEPKRSRDNDTGMANTGMADAMELKEQVAPPSHWLSPAPASYRQPPAGLMVD